MNDAIFPGPDNPQTMCANCDWFYQELQRERKRQRRMLDRIIARGHSSRGLQVDVEWLEANFYALLSGGPL